MVNQVALAVGLGLIAGLIVVISYFLVQFFHPRTPTRNNYEYKRLTSDPRVRSRTIIQQEIPSFYLPSAIPIAIQQPVRDERGISLSTEDYKNGKSLLSPTVRSVYIGKKDEDFGTACIQLNAINTGSMSPPAISPPKSPQRLAVPVKNSSSDSSPVGQHRKVALHKKMTESNLGKLEFSVYHDQSFRLLQIYVSAGIKLQSPVTDSPPDALVIASLSCNDKQIWEQKTSTVKKSRDPRFNEKLEAHGITTAKLRDSTLHFQLFDDLSSKIIGDVDFTLKDLPPNKLINQTLPLSAVDINGTDEDSEEAILKASSAERGELLISLCHNPTDQKLSVKINCARALQPMTKDGKANPFVKLDLTFCGKKLNSRSTKVAHRTLTPNFNEAYMFDLHADKLPQTTLVFKVKHRGRVRDVGIGLVHLGYCVTVESEYKHWEQVMDKPHLEIEQWHKLQEYFIE